MPAAAGEPVQTFNHDGIEVRCEGQEYQTVSSVRFRWVLKGGDVMGMFNKVQRVFGGIAWGGGLVGAIISMVVGADTTQFNSFMILSLVGWVTWLSVKVDQDRVMTDERYARLVAAQVVSDIRDGLGPR